MNRIIFAALLAAGVALPAQAQTYLDSGGTVVPGVVPIQPGVGPLFTSANPGKISGSFSASLSGFQPTPSYASLSVGAASSRIALPSGTVVVVYNIGTNAAYVTIGGSSVTAATSNDFVPAGGWMAFAVGSNSFLAAIETTGATTLNLSGGSGLPTGACCAAGAGGGGSNASVGSTGSAVPASATLGGISVGGTMTAMPGTSNGLKVDGSAVTQPVSAASLPLPSGAATAANQSAPLGPVGAGAAASNSSLTGGVYNSAAPTLTTGQQAATQMDSAGNIKVNIAAGGAAGGTSSTFGSAFPSTGTAAGGEYLSSPPTLTSGQMVALQTDVNGNIKVNVAAGGASGGTSSSFGSAFPSTGTAVGAEYLSSPPTLTTGQMAVPQLNVNGAMKVDGSAATQPVSQATASSLKATVNLNDGSGNAIGSTSGALNVNVNNTNANVGNNVDSVAPAASSSSPVAGYSYSFDGTNWDRARGTTGGSQYAAIQGNAGGVLDTAAGSAASTLVGTQGGGPTAVPMAVIPPTTTSGALVKGTTAAMTGTTSTQVIAAVASQVIYVTAIHCVNSSGSTSTLIAIQDGASGTTLDTLAAGSNFGGEDRTGSTPLFWTTSGNGLYASDVTTGASVTCQASGYSR